MQTSGRNSQTATAFSDKIEKVAKRVVLQTLNDVILGDFHYRPRLRLIDELISGDQYLESATAMTLNNLAWRLATDADPKSRDGQSAVDYAEIAVAVSGRALPDVLDAVLVQ